MVMKREKPRHSRITQRELCRFVLGKLKFDAAREGRKKNNKCKAKREGGAAGGRREEVAGARDGRQSRWGKRASGEGGSLGKVGRQTTVGKRQRGGKLSNKQEKAKR